MKLELRKFTKFVDKTFIEGGKEAKEPVLLVSVAAVFKNPWSGKGFEVNKISEVNEALKAALKCNNPAVINVNVDPKALYSFRRDSFIHRKK